MMSLNDALDRLIDIAEQELEELQYNAIEEPSYAEDARELEEALSYMDVIKAIILEKSS